jgi:hypothetical protein
MRELKIIPDVAARIERFLGELDDEFGISHKSEVQDDWEYLLVQVYLDQEMSIQTVFQVRDRIREMIEPLLPSRPDKPTWSIGIEANGQIIDATIGGRKA